MYDVRCALKNTTLWIPKLAKTTKLLRGQHVRVGKGLYDFGIDGLITY